MLLLTGSEPPRGTVYHATDADRNPMDLYSQKYSSSSGMLFSKSVVVALFVGELAPGKTREYFEHAIRDDVTHLMDKRYLPENEPIWTCRVWAKKVLEIAQQIGCIRLPATLRKFRYVPVVTSQY